METLDHFYSDFSKTLEKAKEATKGVKLTLEEDKIDMTCELCGRPMVVKYGRYGRFIACSGYPECKNVKKIVDETVPSAPSAAKPWCAKRPNAAAFSMDAAATLHAISFPGMSPR